MAHNLPDLQRALQAFQSGSLDESARLCRKIIKTRSPQPQALYILGLIAHSRGDNHKAVTYLKKSIDADPVNVQVLSNYGIIQQQLHNFPDAIAALQEAVRLKPDFYQAHYNLANALVEYDQPSAALPHYQQVISLAPDFADAYFNFGLALKKLQRLDEAVAVMLKAHRLTPHDSNVLFNLGLIYHLNGRPDKAVLSYQQAVGLSPNHETAWYNLGIALYDFKEFAEAIKAFQQVLAINPHNVEALNNLGIACQDADLTDQALAVFQKAIKLRPDLFEAYANLGNVYQQKELFAEAVSAYQQTIAINPAFARAWYNLGKCYSRINDLPQTISAYRKAIELEPNLTQAHWNLSHALLLNGEYQEGFKEYLWRWKRKSAVIPKISRPEWLGWELNGDSILIYTEQGLGDAIQFVRYLPLVKQMGGKITLACHPSLLELFKTLKEPDTLISKTNPDQAADTVACHVPLLNLPTIFNTTLSSIPGQGRYIYPDADLARKHACHFSVNRSEIKVGIVWRGNALHHDDFNRSCSLRNFIPLLELHDIDFFSLQVDGNGLTEEEKEIIEQYHNLHDLGPIITNFADTAGLVSHLDLVISVDTSVAHLAGAMGKETWTLIPFVPEWRWQISGEKTPWYPSMRLLRQTRRHNWHDVFKRIENRLNERIIKKFCPIVDL